jgi:hypothetical protein
MKKSTCHSGGGHDGWAWELTHNPRENEERVKRGLAEGNSEWFYLSFQNNRPVFVLRLLNCINITSIQLRNQEIPLGSLKGAAGSRFYGVVKSADCR